GGTGVDLQINDEAVGVGGVAWPLWAIADVRLSSIDASGVGSVELRFDGPQMLSKTTLKDTPGARQAYDLLAERVPLARAAVPGLVAPVVHPPAAPPAPAAAPSQPQPSAESKRKRREPRARPSNSNAAPTPTAWFRGIGVKDGLIWSKDG